MRLFFILALVLYYAAQVFFLNSMKGDYSSLTALNLVRPLGIAITAWLFFRGNINQAFWVASFAGSGLLRMITLRHFNSLSLVEGVSELILCIAGFLVWRSEIKKLH